MAEPIILDHQKVQRLPIRFAGCAGWLHMPADSVSSDTVAVICPGIGRDGSTGHRPLRFLADQLALAGYPALRFNYPGTGDSQDIEGGNVWSAWVRSLAQAIDRALSVTGARQVILIGLRLGAALAAIAATENDKVAGLVLLEPVVRGNSFATQLRMEEKLATQSEAVENGAIRLHGLHLSPEAMGEIARIDLRSLPLRRDVRVLMLAAQSSTLLRALESAWVGRGIAVTTEIDAETEAFLRPTHLSDEPLPNLPIAAWFQAAYPVMRQFSPISSSSGDGFLCGPAWQETPLVFGTAEHLFGVLCQPADEELCKDIVIFGNSGGDPHDGFARFGVEFARRLARQGIASLRIDFAGLGDSLNPSRDISEVTHPFTVDRREDFTAAIDLAATLGFRSIALHGLCSGAYHALQAAVDDERVSALLCVNLPWFNLRYEKAGPASFARRAMRQLAERGARSLLLFAEGDAGLAALEQHFGPSGEQLVDLPGTELTILTEIDHDLTRPEMKRAAAGRMIAFLQMETVMDRESSPPLQHRATEGVF